MSSVTGSVFGQCYVSSGPTRADKEKREAVATGTLGCDQSRSEVVVVIRLESSSNCSKTMIF